MNEVWVAVVGFATMIAITFLLLKNKTSTMLAFVVIPVIAGFLVGGSISEMGDWITKGLGQTSSIALTCLFAIPYFMALSDTSFFDDLIKGIIKRVNITPLSIFLLTIVIGVITGLDGSITSVFLISVPLLLPFYENFRIDKKIMLFLLSISIMIAFDTPWNTRVLRTASVLGTENAATEIFLKMLPITIVMLVALIGCAVFFGIRAKRMSREGGAKEVDKQEILARFKETELTRHSHFAINAILTILLIVTLVAFPTVPTYYTFALALVLLLAINYPDLKLQNKLLKKYGSSSRCMNEV